MLQVNERVGIVVIGRNEGRGLRATLERSLTETSTVVYVDSASTDDSLAIAADVGVTAISLDPDFPMSAAKARNSGAAHMSALDTPPELIQFVDGDCILEDGWIAAAVDAFDADSTRGAVCGWTREAEPRRNVFHAIADIEWKMGPVGLVGEFAGNVMISRAVFEATGGYDPSIAAGEEPEFGARIRSEGHTIERLARFSTVHDIDMSSPLEWWTRSERSGLGYGAVDDLKAPDGKLHTTEVRRALIWGVAAPALAVATVRWTRLPLLGLVAKYGLSTVRAAQAVPAERAPLDQRLIWGVSCALASVPVGAGYLKHRVRTLRGRSAH